MTMMSESAFWILTALTAEPRHGYGILRDVEELSGGTVSLRVTTLYAGLERLEHSGLIHVSSEEVVDSRARRYYLLTPDGRQALLEEAERLRARARVARAGLASGSAVPGVSIVVS
jgi:PadR family transcriptional regulator PadR